MSIEGIIGIGATILFGIIGIPSFVIAVAKKKYPKRMEFYVLDLVRIISPLVRKYDSIKLLHNDQETKNVSFLRGMFLCVGDEDVELKSDNNSGGLQVSLPDGYKWLEVHPQECTKGLSVECTLDEEKPNIIHVSSDLFKRDETFTFDAYIEGKDDGRLEYSKVKVGHRISNAGGIKTQKIDMSRTKANKKKLWLIGFMSILYLVLGGATSYGMFYERPIRYVDKQNKDLVYSATVIDNDSIAITRGINGVLPWKNIHLSIDEFNQRYDIYLGYHKVTKGEVVLWVMGPVFGCVLLMLIFIIKLVSFRRQKRVVKAYAKICK